ncbi:PREDICTED: uncharacterized protein LOC106149641 [Chinchilla lanigera]|uniref:uncharacterized protein LOC106149641 n=1 Tax=Chinchilla lanigera TaxID=34839 RepID=UPI0006968081|nr:PREDICTED: uncharacterized protein LOC106149641 [Chinchilla lanigera]
MSPLSPAFVLALSSAELHPARETSAHFLSVLISRHTLPSVRGSVYPLHWALCSCSTGRGAPGAGPFPQGTWVPRLAQVAGSERREMPRPHPPRAARPAAHLSAALRGRLPPALQGSVPGGAAPPRPWRGVLRAAWACVGPCRSVLALALLSHVDECPGSWRPWRPSTGHLSVPLQTDVLHPDSVSPEAPRLMSVLLSARHPPAGPQRRFSSETCLPRSLFLGQDELWGPPLPPCVQLLAAEVRPGPAVRLGYCTDHGCTAQVPPSVERPFVCVFVFFFFLVFWFFGFFFFRTRNRTHDLAGAALNPQSLLLSVLGQE